MQGRYMAFDYGSKRVGIAVTDPLKIIATGLNTLHPHSIIPFLENYVPLEKVILFIVGKPLQMDASPSAISPQVEAFIRKIKKHFPDIPLVRIDERFTSKMAERTMLESGINKKSRRNKETVDKISAVLILQSYMEWECRENR